MLLLHDGRRAVPGGLREVPGAGAGLRRRGLDRGGHGDHDAVLRRPVREGRVGNLGPAGRAHHQRRLRRDDHRGLPRGRHLGLIWQKVYREQPIVFCQSEPQISGDIVLRD